MKKMSTQFKKMFKTIKKENCIEHNGKQYISLEDFDNFTTEMWSFIVALYVGEKFDYDVSELTEAHEKFEHEIFNR